MTSAQLEAHPLDETSAETEAPFALRAQVAERVAAHRARRGHPAATAGVTPIAPPTPAKQRAARIAATVAERYAHSQSYRAFLAAEAERAIREAEAAAEVAALSARAVAEAQNQLLFELDQITTEAPTEPESAAPIVAKAAQSEPAQQTSSQGGLTVRMAEEVERVPMQLTTARAIYAGPVLDEDEALALDEEIAYRQNPVLDEPPTDIPANLLEFPRQLVASRKARPRLAEGPLREDPVEAHDAAQLRIFEVEASQISTAPVVESAVPEWSSIVLPAQPAAAPAARAQVAEAVESAYPVAPVSHVPQTAAFGLRLMAGMVDSCIVLAGELAFVATSALIINKMTENAPLASHLSPQTAAIGFVAVFAVFTLLYQTLFFTFSECTPGMRYARIGLCTFSDDNPTRKEMRRRIFAAVLAACPLGLGYVWAVLDEDGLGWHDRISRMYQRSY